jgi:hypothetical protein
LTFSRIIILFYLLININLLINYHILSILIFILISKVIIGDWGLGIGDWGLGIGDWGLGPIPNPQSPIPLPNPQYLIKNIF